MVYSLRNSTIFEEIKNKLDQVKYIEKYWYEINIFGNRILKYKLIEEDD